MKFEESILQCHNGDSAGELYFKVLQNRGPFGAVLVVGICSVWDSRIGSNMCSHILRVAVACPGRSRR